MVGGWSTYPISGYVDGGQVVWAQFISATSHDGVSVPRDHRSFCYLDCQVLISWVRHSILLFWVYRWMECLYLRFCVAFVCDIGNVYTQTNPVIHVCPKSGLRSSLDYSVILITTRKSEWWEDSPPLLSRLTSNSQRFAWFCLLSAGMEGTCYHACCCHWIYSALGCVPITVRLLTTKITVLIHLDQVSTIMGPFQCERQLLNN